MGAEPVRASVHIEAPPEVVFRYCTDSEAMVEWMGRRANLDPTRGGRFELGFAGMVVRGEYLELDPPRRLVFSWGHVGSEELPAGASRVEVELGEQAGGTLVELVHSGLPAGPQRDEHGRGWRRYLARLADSA